MPDVTMPSKFEVNLWNGKYYASVVMPDGTRTELNSSTDLTYTQWQTKIKAVWDASQNLPPEPNMCPLNNKLCPNYREVAK